MFDYEIKLAQSPEEKAQAARLRFEIFKKELHPGEIEFTPTDTETDVYDEFCDHLIVIDKSKNLVVGTYRLLLGSKVNPKIGFYSERIFDITRIKNLQGQLLELSRSCVHKDYREGTVINLLWDGIASYIKENSVTYLFGSVRLYTTDPQEISKTLNLITKKYYSPEEFRVLPLAKCTFKDTLATAVSAEEESKLARKLPPLIKGYLRLGVKFCSPAAINPDFNSVVFFILLDIRHIPAAYRRHFLKN